MQDQNRKETDRVESDVKRTIKDSVFTDLFGMKKYLFQMYQALHPEDKETTEDDLTDIRLKNILVDDIYNDLGFSVGDRLIILTEAQSLCKSLHKDCYV